jgi:hypothetical protein
VELFSVMFTDNNKIVGIICGNKEIKLLQFDDDTTLFLNGTQAFCKRPAIY